VTLPKDFKKPELVSFGQGAKLIYKGPFKAWPSIQTKNGQNSRKLIEIKTTR
jgi:hypothetical protein